MPPPALELAGIFRQYGPAYRQAHKLPLHQHRLMQAIETCRAPALGGSVEWCDHCQYTHIQCRPCRNRQSHRFPLNNSFLFITQRRPISDSSPPPCNSRSVESSTPAAPGEAPAIEKTKRTRFPCANQTKQNYLCPAKRTQFSLAPRRPNRGLARSV